MAAFGDYDRDGWLDVYIATNMLSQAGGSQGRRGYMFHNNGNGAFTNVTDRAGITGETRSHSATWWDYDNDGWPDLYVAYDYGVPDSLYHNNRDGTFTNTAKRFLPHTSFSSMGADYGDVNNDGLIDFFVADMAATIAAEMGFGDEEIERVRTAGRLHDIGKIGIREEILNKQGPLTDEEYAHVQQHVVVGSQILAPLVHLKNVIQFVRSHHERWDGQGYPDRLSGDAIPFGARIIGAVEIYDALTTSRPYQEKMPPAMAVERMRDLVGTVLDPAVHNALETVVLHRPTLTFLDEAKG